MAHHDDARNVAHPAAPVESVDDSSPGGSIRRASAPIS